MCEMLKVRVGGRFASRTAFNLSSVVLLSAYLSSEGKTEEKMKLYHFTPAHLFPLVMRDGISRGMTPVKVNRLIGFVPNTQWLTSNPEFTQSWSEGSTLPYDRTAFRLTIELENDKNLLTWTKFKRQIRGHVLPHFDAFGDPENWYVYVGQIDPIFITDHAEKP